MNQLYIYMCSHISSLLHLPPSHPPHPTPLGGHKAQSWSLCAMRLLPTSYFTFGSVYMSMPLSLFVETCILKLAKIIPIRSGKIQSYTLHDYHSIHTITWMNLQRVMLAEKKSQSPKIAYCMILEMTNYSNGRQIARG